VHVAGGGVMTVQDSDDTDWAAVRLSALVEWNDKIREIDEPADVAYAAAELLGQTLQVSRAGYGTIDTEEETIVIERDWNAPGIASLAGKPHFRDYGCYIEDLKRGETVVFADAEKDPRTMATADALKAISAQSVVNMPIRERGGLVALLYLNHESAREWRPEELELIRDIAERTRSVVERRRLEKELREGEQRFRTVFQNAAVGMLEIDADWSIRSANAAYGQLVGLSTEELSGQNCLAFTLRTTSNPVRMHCTRLRPGRRANASISKSAMCAPTAKRSGSGATLRRSAVRETMRDSSRSSRTSARRSARKASSRSSATPLRF
jgi:PAS domain-containing protein